MCPFAQWLGRCDLTAGAGGHSLVRELRSRRLNSKKKTKNKLKMDWSPSIHFMPPKPHVNVSSQVSTFHADYACKYVSHILLFSRVQFQQLKTFA